MTTREEQLVIDAAHDNIIACSKLFEATRRVRNADACDEETVSCLRIEEGESIAQVHRTHAMMRNAVHALLRKRSKDAVASHKDGET